MVTIIGTRDLIVVETFIARSQCELHEIIIHTDESNPSLDRAIDLLAAVPSVTHVELASDRSDSCYATQNRPQTVSQLRRAERSGSSVGLKPVARLERLLSKQLERDSSNSGSRLLHIWLRQAVAQTKIHTEQFASGIIGESTKIQLH
ncbi:hypothetical protein C8J57DRAFT_1263065 [Mycena rebaudengoi]|nr:hypothetical protein C8J57DRAFT_1263065 [Mycena rebaudengoi]